VRTSSRIARRGLGIMGRVASLRKRMQRRRARSWSRACFNFCSWTPRMDDVEILGLTKPLEEAFDTSRQAVTLRI
jgi:hypothetical protein